MGAGQDPSDTASEVFSATAETPAVIGKGPSLGAAHGEASGEVGDKHWDMKLNKDGSIELTVRVKPDGGAEALRYQRVGLSGKSSLIFQRGSGRESVTLYGGSEGKALFTGAVERDCQLIEMKWRFRINV